MRIEPERALPSVLLRTACQRGIRAVPLCVATACRGWLSLRAGETVERRSRPGAGGILAVALCAATVSVLAEGMRHCPTSRSRPGASRSRPGAGGSRGLVCRQRQSKAQAACSGTIHAAAAAASLSAGPRSKSVWTQ